MKTTKEKIAVMQAYEDGADIEISSVSGWDLWECGRAPTWCWQTSDYRIKPEPKVIWVNEHYDYLACHKTKTEATQFDASKRSEYCKADRVAVKYIEVIDD